MKRIARKSMPTGRLLLAGSIIVLAGCVVGPSFGIAQDKTSSPGLSGTTWQLRTIQPMADEQPTITVEQPERYTLRFHADGRLTLQLDCNRGTGSWQATPAASSASGQLAFGPIATTRMFCPPPSLDTRVAHDLGLVRSYLLRDDHRLLTLQSDTAISAWQPAPADDPEKRPHQ